CPWPPYRSDLSPPFHRKAAIDLNGCEFERLRLLGRLRDLHAAGRVQHGLDDVVVTGAAADIALELVAHGRLVELAAIAMDNVDRGHDHARGAEAALQPVIVAERRLHRVQVVALGNAFDRGDARSRGLSGQHGAGFYRLAIDVNDTGAALAGVAADMGASQVQMIAQQM